MVGVLRDTLSPLPRPPSKRGPSFLAPDTWRFPPQVLPLPGLSPSLLVTMVIPVYIGEQHSGLVWWLLVPCGLRSGAAGLHNGSASSGYLEPSTGVYGKGKGIVMCVYVRQVGMRSDDLQSLSETLEKGVLPNNKSRAQKVTRHHPSAKCVFQKQLAQQETAQPT